MNVLAILAGLIGFAICLFIIVGVGGIVLMWIWGLWPSLVGAAGMVALWISGHDNLGVLFMLGMIVGQFAWVAWLESPDCPCRDWFDWF